MYRLKTKNKKNKKNGGKTLSEVLLFFIWSIALVLFLSVTIIRSWNNYYSKSRSIENLRGAAEQVFVDVPASHPEAASIYYLQKRSVINGGKENLYRPDDLLTRAELITMVIKAVRVQPHPVSNSFCFSDVKDEWFAPFICYAARKNYIQGFPNGRFDPFASVTFEQMSTVIANVFQFSLPEYHLREKGNDDFITRAEGAGFLYKVLSAIAP